MSVIALSIEQFIQLGLSLFQLPMLFRGEEYNEDNAAKLNEALGWLNTFLDGRAFVAGDNLTIADISIIVTITNIDVSV